LENDTKINLKNDCSVLRKPYFGNLFIYLHFGEWNYYVATQLVPISVDLHLRLILAW
jgi:hypothetical protein